jgi:hypothetical protein
VWVGFLILHLDKYVRKGRGVLLVSNFPSFLLYSSIDHTLATSYGACVVASALLLFAFAGGKLVYEVIWPYGHSGEHGRSPSPSLLGVPCSTGRAPRALQHAAPLALLHTCVAAYLPCRTEQQRTPAAPRVKTSTRLERNAR